MVESWGCRPLPPRPLSAAPLPPADAAAFAALVSSANAALDPLHMAIKHVDLPAGGGGAWTLVNADPDDAARAHGAPWPSPAVGAYLRAVLTAAAAAGDAAGSLQAEAALAVEAAVEGGGDRAARSPASASAASPAPPSPDAAAAAPARAIAPPKPLTRSAKRAALASICEGGWMRRTEGGGFAIGPRAFLELGGLLTGVVGGCEAVLEEWGAMGVVVAG